MSVRKSSARAALLVAFGLALALVPPVRAAETPSGKPAEAPAKAAPAAPVRTAAPAAVADPEPAKLADTAIANLTARLKLTPEQVTSLKPLMATHLGKMRQAFVDYSHDRGAAAPMLIQEVRELRARLQANLEPILSPEQMEEVASIRKEVDAQIKDTICNERMTILKQRLSLKPDQEARVRPVLSDDFDRKINLAAMMTAPTGGPAARQPMTGEIQKIEAQTASQLKGILSADQMKTYLAYREELGRQASERLD